MQVVLLRLINSNKIKAHQRQNQRRQKIYQIKHMMLKIGGNIQKELMNWMREVTISKMKFMSFHIKIKIIDSNE